MAHSSSRDNLLGRAVQEASDRVRGSSPGEDKRSIAILGQEKTSSDYHPTQLILGKPSDFSVQAVPD
ncbi:hypothetical protein MAPG_10321 [Magnaporthiopsis poae ATCC 64411]|uniref:Uncharacterized protein n=1 Tax=Magnaporthiopsis poae (strain ATCC 64411 / 73-15) TaxID=644358 RepID=A0A0C4ECA6_MAGP6|nr:hypothetical protein MAPG_10321 [Magnaporthiopsis poae ATCC 64411]